MPSSVEATAWKGCNGGHHPQSHPVSCNRRTSGAPFDAVFSLMANSLRCSDGTRPAHTHSFSIGCLHPPNCAVPQGTKLATSPLANPVRRARSPRAGARARLTLKSTPAGFTGLGRHVTMSRRNAHVERDLRMPTTPLRERLFIRGATHAAVIWLAAPPV